MLGVVPATRPAAEPTDRTVTDRVLRFLDMLGAGAEAVDQQLVVTPACGLAGADAGWARRALTLSRQVAANLSGS